MCDSRVGEDEVHFLVWCGKFEGDPDCCWMMCRIMGARE